ncbi:MAG TPA: hypothetical protein VLH83_06120 [Chthoniobacterales bacterium]|nr:hypothetical protein [Chthoniobacterales bacterium]
MAARYFFEDDVAGSILDEGPQNFRDWNTRLAQQTQNARFVLDAGIAVDAIPSSLSISSSFFDDYDPRG